MVENETSNEVLENVTSIIEESSSKILDVTIDRADQFSKVYTDKISGVKCKIFIVWFTIFRHRTMFYHNRENLNRNVKIKLDVTKKHFLISIEVMTFFKNNEVVNFVMVDINGGLKVVFKFLFDFVDLRDIFNKEGIA